jgi:hypothetical protein
MRMKIKKAVCSTIAVVFSLGFVALAASRTPSNSDQGATCNCTQAMGTSCSWHKTDNSSGYCNCGGTCCHDTTSTENATITTYSGGYCSGTGAEMCSSQTSDGGKAGTIHLFNGDCS